MMAQLMKKNDELQLNSMISEFKLDIREKEDKIKDYERQIEILKLQ